MKNRTKILYLHHGGGQGGAPQSLIYLIKNLDKDKYEPIVACGFNEPYAKEFFESHGYSPINIPVARFAHCFPSGYYKFYKPRSLRNFLWWVLKQNKSKKVFKKKIKAINPGIIHLNSLTIAPLAGVAKKMGYKVVLHVREAAIRLHKWDIRWHWLKWLANNFVDRIIYICKDNRDKLTGKTEHSSVIYNPIPFDKFDKDIDAFEIRKNFNISLNSIVLFFPGGSSPRPKGIYPFLDALKKIVTVNKNVIAMIPKIDSNTKILEYIEKLDLNQKIIKVPFSDKVEEYFAASDIVVTPFIVPHFSRAVIESGAMAKPVVGSKIGGIEEVVEDGITGLLVPPNDPRVLALAINKICADEELAKKMGEAGYKQAKELFDADKNAAETLKIYEELL